MRHSKVSTSDFDQKMQPIYPYPARISSRTEMYVDSTRGGILQIYTLADVIQELEDATGEDSKVNGNFFELKKPNIDNEKGME